jgi:hypothetical protein
MPVKYHFTTGAGHRLHFPGHPRFHRDEPATKGARRPSPSILHTAGSKAPRGARHRQRRSPSGYASGVSESFRLSRSPPPT